MVGVDLEEIGLRSEHVVVAEAGNAVAVARTAVAGCGVEAGMEQPLQLVWDCAA